MEQIRDVVRIKHNAPYGHTRFEAELTVLTFKDEDGFYIAYCPSLSLSDYGDSEEKAKANFAETLALYFETTVEWGTLTKDLKAHGWDVRSKKMKKISAPTLEQLQTSDPTYKSLIDSGTAYNVSRTNQSVQQAIA
ncbi:MAG: type II toxin-antitoxin system HicB family antitoxin [Porphyromonas sp.]|jgi:uncharacterised protein family (UPF0150)|nr:type II toxin-antitoxin system HicB family antitoxin [Porphyromonas sp.]DAK47893.1 MAG TPA: putative nuclease [Caudoviricetes sp.]